MRRLTLLLLIGVFGLLSLGGTIVKRGPNTTMATTTTSARYASFHIDPAVDGFFANTSVDNTPVQFLSTPAAPVIKDTDPVGNDPTGDFSWDDTNDCFLYGGTNGVFSVEASLAVTLGGAEIAAPPANDPGVNNTVTIGMGVGSIGTTDLAVNGFSASTTAHSGTNQVIINKMMDLVATDCVAVYAQCTAGATQECDPEIIQGTVVFTQVAGIGGTTAGTANVTTTTTDPYPVTATDIENGVILVSCGAGADTCNVNLPELGIGKVVTIISNSTDGDTINVNPDDDQLVETTDVAGDALENSSVGYQDKITLIGMDTGSPGNIAILGKTGTWLDAN